MNAGKMGCPLARKINRSKGSDRRLQEMDPSVKRLLPEHEALSSTLTTHIKSGVVGHTWNPSAGGLEAGRCQPSVIRQTQSFGERLCLKKLGERLLRNSTQEVG